MTEESDDTGRSDSMTDGVDETDFDSNSTKGGGGVYSCEKTMVVVLDCSTATVDFGKAAEMSGVPYSLAEATLPGR